VLQGVALVFAPSRNGTFDKFCEMAQSTFVTDRQNHYNDDVWALHMQVSLFSVR
jgi:hypothetical protein